MLGRVLSGAVNLVDPDAVVLGGIYRGLMRGCRRPPPRSCPAGWCRGSGPRAVAVSARRRWRVTRRGGRRRWWCRTSWTTRWRTRNRWVRPAREALGRAGGAVRAWVDLAAVAVRARAASAAPARASETALAAAAGRRGHRGGPGPPSVPALPRWGQRTASRWSIASWSNASKAIPRVRGGVHVEVLVRGAVGEQAGQSVPGGGAGQFVQAGGAQGRPHLGIGAEGGGALLEDEVVAHTAGGRGPDPVVVLGARGLKSKWRGPSYPLSSRSTSQNACRRSPAPKRRSWSYLMPDWPLRSMWKSLSAHMAWAMPCGKLSPAICSCPVSGLTPTSSGRSRRSMKARAWPMVAAGCRRAARSAWARRRSGGRTPAGRRTPPAGRTPPSCGAGPGGRPSPRRTRRPHGRPRPRRSSRPVRRRGRCCAGSCGARTGVRRGRWR